MDDDRGGNSLLAALAHPQVLNPLAAYQGAAETANSIWHNRQNQANQAAGQAYQGAIDEQGRFDPTKFRQNLVAAGPTAALAAGAGVESAQRLQGEQIDQGSKVRAVLADELAGLADPNLTPEQLHNGMVNAATRLISAGMPPQQVLSYTLNMPPDPAGRRAALEQISRSLMSPETRQQTIYGAPITVDQGDATVGGTRSVQTGALNVPSGQGVPMNLTPGQKVQTQPTIDASGAPGTVPIGSRYNPDGSLKPPGWGRNNGGYVAPGGGASGGGVSGGASAAPTGFAPTGQAPGVAEAQRVAAEASAKAGTQIYSAADAATQQKAQLQTMESDLAKISTGPTSERAATVNAFLQKYHLPSTMSAEEIASSEGFAKIAKQIALAQAGALGAGTDEKLTTSMGANPNRDLSKLGNQQILAMLQGNADAIKARGVAYDQWKKSNPTGDSNSFLTEFNKDFDPRVYQWGYQIRTMTPEQRKAAFDALPDKEAFRRKYNAAVAAKLIDPNGY